jgi:hypothetical protein
VVRAEEKRREEKRREEKAVKEEENSKRDLELSAMKWKWSVESSRFVYVDLIVPLHFPSICVDCPRPRFSTPFVGFLSFPSLILSSPPPPLSRSFQQSWMGDHCM